ncbi:MAG: putative DNA binding domain-containing protein [Candidatus Jettenia caeni]|nr:putative DNA binding domain-containing protein [Candidatus Jettenia caeni]UJS17044.1 MAG: putative DNA binding domain-containing protein [Candidatus Jettenia sp.]
MEYQSDLLKNILDIPTETQTVKFKRLLGDKVVTKVIETIVAMSNTDGGLIILGVDDPEKTKAKGSDRIYGIDENVEVFDAISKEVQRIVPPISGIWPPGFIDVDEKKKRISLVSVPKAIDSFHSINNHVFVRGEKGNRQLTAHEVIKFAYAKGFEKADKSLVNVDFDLLKTLYFEGWKEARRINDSPIETILEKTGLARKNDEGKLLPTLAAVLLFAEYPNDLTETKCAVRVLQYTGTIENIAETPNLIGIPKTIQGQLIKQINEAHEYVLTLLRAGIRIPSGFKTIYQIPERAVMEAITNAIIHRDYHMKRDIEVKIYEDRVEVESLGLFPYNITRTNIGQVRAEGYRNDLLVKHLREFPSPPNLDQNEGVRAMRNEMSACNLYPPIFLTYPVYQDSVKVVLLNAHRPSEWEKISTYLKENKYITNENARKITGIVQRDKMTHILKNWVKQGLLIQMVPSSGYVRGTKYKLPEIPEVR